MENFSGFRGKFVNTLETDDESQFVFSRDIETFTGFSLTTETDFITFSRTVFLNVLFGTFEDYLSLDTVFLFFN